MAEIAVAPFVGAWIETQSGHGTSAMRSVAPFVGAWIETGRRHRTIICGRKSLPSWERGLKPSESLVEDRHDWSLPSWERGLKPKYYIDWLEKNGSLPSWERGLKHLMRFLCHMCFLSLPSWERGLKLKYWYPFYASICVAPFVGAWIETSVKPNCLKICFCRSLRGSVD